MPARQKRPPGRPRGFDPDEAVERAALVFWEQGYEGTTVADLTEATHLSKQSLYGAFGSKADLYRRCLAWYGGAVAADVARSFDDEPDVGTATGLMLERMAADFTRADRPLGCMRSTAALRCATEHSDVVRHAADLRGQTVAALEARLDRGVRDEQLAAGTDTGALSVFLDALIVGMSVAAQDGTSAERLHEVARIAARCTDPTA